MMIKDLQVNDKYDLELAVKKSEIRTTRTKKSYLWLTLTDGSTDITANVWDWPHVNAPEVNSVLHLTGTVDSYNDIKQLKVSTINRTDKTVEVFLPKSPVPFEGLKEELDRLVESVENPNCRHMLDELLTAPFFTAPGAVSVHHAYKHGLLEHSVSVALLAEAVHTVFKTASRDILITGALLHDIGKTLIYTIDGLDIGYTTIGTLMDHILLGSQLVSEFPFKEARFIQHIIASHHGELEYGSPVTPKFLEAFIIHWCDNMDAKHKIIIDTNEGLTTEVSEKVWALNTRLLNQLEIPKGG